MPAEMVLSGAHAEWGDNTAAVVSTASVDNELIWDAVRGNMEVHQLQSEIESLSGIIQLLIICFAIPVHVLYIKKIFNYSIQLFFKEHSFQNNIWMFQEFQTQMKDRAFSWIWKILSQNGRDLRLASTSIIHTIIMFVRHRNHRRCRELKTGRNRY